jgi:hypothetical protein
MAATAPSPQLCRSHRPERTLIDRALVDPFERFLGVYEERYEPTHGYLRRAVAPAVYRDFDRGISAHGAAAADCSLGLLAPPWTCRTSRELHLCARVTLNRISGGRAL